MMILRKQSPAAEKCMGELIANALSTLLSSKQLYQNTEIDLSSITKLCDGKYTRESLEQEFKLRPWIPASKCTGYTAHERHIWSAANAGVQPLETAINNLNVPFIIPTIETWCSACRKAVYHDSIPYNAYSPCHLNPDAVKELPGIQTFIFDFQCVSCKGPPLKFIVSRCQNKIQLCGRSKPFNQTPPSSFPKNVREIYINAVSAASCGDIYAGFYHLRTLLEHHMKSVCKLDMLDTKDSEELCHEYYSTLDEVVAKKASITTEYKLCSKNLHARAGTYDDFVKTLGKIEAHFRFIESLKSLS